MLGADILDGFKKAGIPRNYRIGEPVVLANEPSTGMYLILKGEVKILRRTADGEQIEVATLGPGQTMGEISLLLHQPHSATVIAKTDLETLLLTNTRLLELKREDPELALKLYEILAFSLSNYIMLVNGQLDSARRTITQLEKRLQETSLTENYF